MLTVEMVERALPPNLKAAATQTFVDQINTIVADPIVAEQVRENFISYTGVLKDGKFKTEDYLNAVTFVSFKLMGDSNQDAYFKTFPQRYMSLTAKGTSSKDIAAYVAAYARGKLVNLILEQTLVPSWVLNQHLYQEALNTQADLMRNARSEKVQSDAANSLLTHLARPAAAAQGTLKIEMTETSGIKEMREMLAKLAQGQKTAIESGTPTKEIAGQRLIEKTVDADFVEVTP